MQPNGYIAENDAMGGAGSLPANWSQLALGGLSTLINVGAKIAESKYVPQKVNEVQTVDSEGRLQNAGTPTKNQNVSESIAGFIQNPQVSLTTFLLVVVVAVLIARK